MKMFFKKYMVAGTIVLVPVVATIWVLIAVIGWADNFVLSLLPRRIWPEVVFGYNIPGVGLLLTIIIILIVGIFTRLYIGNKLLEIGESIFSRLPFGRAIYSATKQVVNMALSQKDPNSHNVVMVEYPKAGSYAMSFLIGESSMMPQKEGEEKNVIVFVPTSPNPTSGFLLFVKRSAIIQTNLTAEDATKFIISGGLLAKKSDLA